MLRPWLWSPGEPPEQTSLCQVVRRSALESLHGIIQEQRQVGGFEAVSQP